MIKSSMKLETVAKPIRDPTIRIKNMDQRHKG